MKIGFIGLGNMATAIIGGLLREDTTLNSEDGNATVITAANIIGCLLYTSDAADE